MNKYLIIVSILLAANIATAQHVSQRKPVKKAKQALNADQIYLDVNPLSDGSDFKIGDSGMDSSNQWYLDGCPTIEGKIIVRPNSTKLPSSSDYVLGDTLDKRYFPMPPSYTTCQRDSIPIKNLVEGMVIVIKASDSSEDKKLFIEIWSGTAWIRVY